MVLIVAFSLGLAGTLTGLGLLVVYARRLLPQLQSAGTGPTLGRMAAALPAVSAVLIVGVGCLLTANALPGVV
jgi:nickel/cobalt exporter